MAEYKPNTISISDHDQVSEPKASTQQIGGDHYKNAAIQPGEYVHRNKIGFFAGCVIKRMSRYDKSTGGGAKDLVKAIHEIELILEYDYQTTVAEYKDRVANI